MSDFSTVVEATIVVSPVVMKSASPIHVRLLLSTDPVDVPQSMFTPEIDHVCTYVIMTKARGY